MCSVHYTVCSKQCVLHFISFYPYPLYSLDFDSIFKRTMGAPVNEKIDRNSKKKLNHRTRNRAVFSTPKYHVISHTGWAWKAEITKNHMFFSSPPFPFKCYRILFFNLPNYSNDYMVCIECFSPLQRFISEMLLIAFKMHPFLVCICNINQDSVIGDVTDRRITFISIK